MEKIRLLRTGQAPLAFVGSPIANAEFSHGDDSHNRKVRIRIFKTANKYVCRVKYITKVKLENNKDIALVFDDILGIRDYLTNTQNIESYVVGYPDDAKYDKKQAILLNEIKKGYLIAVWNVLSNFPELDEVID